MSHSPPRFFVRRRLIAMAVALPVIETAILWAVGMETALGIAPQVSAPAPFDVFHDLRWLLVYHRSWVGLLIEAAHATAADGGMGGPLVRGAEHRRCPVVGEPAGVSAAYRGDRRAVQRVGVVRHRARRRRTADPSVHPRACGPRCRRRRRGRR